MSPPRKGAGGPGEESAAGTTPGYQNQLEATQRKMLRQKKSEAKKRATQQGGEIATESPRRRGEAKPPERLRLEGVPRHPAPPLPTLGLPDCRRAVPEHEGHLLPDPGCRSPAEAGNTAADTLHPRPPARPASPPAPLRFPRHPRRQPAHPSGRSELPPPPPLPPTRPRLRAVLSPNYQCPPDGWVERPCPGKAACGRLPRARGTEGLLSKRTHIIHAKLIPAASRPPARGCAPSLAKPRSLHPPPPPPPGGGVPGSAGDGTSRESCKMSTPWAKRGGRRQGRAGPPRPLHFYRRRKRVWSGHRSPRLSGPPSHPARPGPLPGHCLTPGPGRPRRAASANR
ncbi:basic proline-rich protein-like [Prionailurus bengalensis]|uniref:basic proline-rich protein-like n=1 Tax=Prionailurus bengalensis TaxID=37029 RepID=UPI001CA87D82|nr:basic proline-rich protein-like [Prionailurus bengalensis]